MDQDVLAIAIDWLDAYRAKDIETIVTMYAKGAVVECHCGRPKVIHGEDAIRAFWKQRVVEYPATELDALEPGDDSTSISYITKEGVVGATIRFDQNGKIVSSRCGPLAAAKR
jgi:hypothetical protein